MDQTDDPLIFRLFTEIGIIEQLARNRLERSLPDDLKMSQFIVLNHLARLGGEWSPARLAAAFQVTKGAMTNSLQRLEMRGLVLVKPDPNDGRGKRVSLTKSGLKMRLHCVDAVRPLLAELSREVADKDIETALPTLEKIKRYLDTHRL